MLKKIKEIVSILAICAICIGKLTLLWFDNSDINDNKLLAAQSADDGATIAGKTPAMNPSELFRAARLAYNDKFVVAASMRQETLIHDQHFIGVGKYMEKKDNAKRYLRMEMSYSCHGVRHSVQYIADGAMDLFWIYKNVGTDKELQRVDAFKLNAQNANPELVASLDNKVITPISLAGIPYMLFQIDKFYKITSCSVLSDERTKVPYYVVTGVWKPEKFPIPECVSDNVIAWNSVPLEIPDTVKIYLGVNDLFPYKMNYYRNVGSTPTLISKLNFYDVSFDVRLNPKQFGFEPPSDAMPTDVTDRYMR